MCVLCFLSRSKSAPRLLVPKFLEGGYYNESDDYFRNRIRRYVVPSTEFSAAGRSYRWPTRKLLEEDAEALEDLTGTAFGRESVRIGPHYRQSSFCNPLKSLPMV